MKKFQLMTIKFYLFLAILVLPTFLFGQKIQLELEFEDAEKNLVSNIAVQLFKAEEFIGGSYTDSLGTVSFPISQVGEFRIVTSSLEYKLLDTMVDVQKEQLKFTFQLESTALNLDEVTVSAVKEVIKRDGETIQLDINGSKVLGSNAADILQRAPGIDIMNNNISFLGKGVIILRDGKRVNISSAQLMNFLKNKKAQGIEKIELIINPDASYDANFDGRVINIITKKREGNGYELSLYSNLSRNRDYFSPDGSFDFHIRRNDFSIYGDAGYYMSNRVERSNEDRTFIEENIDFSETSTDDYTDKGPYHELGIDYDISPKSVIGLKYEGSTDISSGDIIGSTVISTNELVDSSIYLENTHFEDIIFNNINLNYYTLLDSSTTKLNFDIDLGNQIAEYGTDQLINILSSDQELINSGQNYQLLSVDNKIFAIRGDLTKKINNHSFSFGLKYAFSRADQNISERLDSGIENLPLFEDTLRYDEAIYAAYATLKGKFSGFNYSLGLRAEYTDYDGISSSATNDISNTYGRIFPQITISKKLNQGTFSLAYKENIIRPTYNQLVPYKRYTSALYYYTGNPNLQAYFPRNIDFLYSWQNSLYFKLSYQSANNRILEYNRTLDNSIITEGTKENNGSSERFYILLSYTKRFSKWFYLKARGTYITGSQSIVLDTEQTFNYDAYSFILAPSFNLTDDLSLSFYSYYVSDIFSGVTQNNNIWYVNFDLTYEIMDGDAEIGIGGRDLFLTSITKSSANYGNLIERSRNDWNSRYFSISFSYYLESDDVGSQRNRKTANDQSIQRL